MSLGSVDLAIKRIGSGESFESVKDSISIPNGSEIQLAFIQARVSGAAAICIGLGKSEVFYFPIDDVAIELEKLFKFVMGESPC